MKRLVVCCDGTWNSEGDWVKPGEEGSCAPPAAAGAEAKQPQKVPTNVWKLYNLVAPQDEHGVQQRVFYQPGVGTDPSRSKIRQKLNRALGGGLGWGLDANILEAYRWLIHEYEEGDELWLFGFSRGAYTARSLAGLLRNCGLLHQRHECLLPRAMKLYRARDDRSHPDAPQSESFRRNYSREIHSIEFVGVWDTVGSLGIPGVLGAIAKLVNRRYRFHDVQLSSRVQNAYHAIAVDERRPVFRPTLWGEKQDGKQDEGHPDLEDRETVEQVWFPGVHSDIGGGYKECGLSDITLRWMLDKARCCDLALDEPCSETAIQPNPRDQLHDSRWLVHKIFFFIRLIREFEPGRRQFVSPAVDDRMASTMLGYKPTNIRREFPRLQDPSDGCCSRHPTSTQHEPPQ